MTLTATVVPSNGPGVPTGTVSFSDGTTPLGACTLDAAGVCSIAVSSLAAGAHSLTAAYAQDVSFAGSSSSALAYTITRYPVGIAVSPSANPAQYGATVGFTVRVDATTGTIELRATFPNTDSSFVPGQLVNVTVELGEIPGATVVPREAVNEGPDGTYVYAVSADNRAELRKVKVLFDDGASEAVEGAVQPDDRVIVDGQLRVVPGAAVFVDTPQRDKQPRGERR